MVTVKRFGPAQAGGLGAHVGGEALLVDERAIQARAFAVPEDDGRELEGRVLLVARRRQGPTVEERRKRRPRVFDDRLPRRGLLGQRRGGALGCVLAAGAFEEARRQTECLLGLDVADDRKDGVAGRVVRVVEGAELCGVDVLHRGRGGERLVRVREVAVVDELAELLRGEPVGRDDGPQPVLVAHDIALRLERGGGNGEGLHAVGLEPQAERELARRQELGVARVVGRRRRVHLGAARGGEREVRARGDVLRTLEHEVLEEVRVAGVRAVLVATPDVVGDADGDGGRGVIRREHDAEAVRQLLATDRAGQAGPTGTGLRARGGRPEADRRGVEPVGSGDGWREEERQDGQKGERPHERRGSRSVHSSVGLRPSSACSRSQAHRLAPSLAHLVRRVPIMRGCRPRRRNRWLAKGRQLDRESLAGQRFAGAVAFLALARPRSPH